MKQFIQSRTLISTPIISPKKRSIRVLTQWIPKNKRQFKRTIFLVLFFSFRIAIGWAAAPPTINSFAPNSGMVGTTVTITGTNFNIIPTNNVVFFGATKATVITATSTSLEVTVPSGASYQPISVTDITTGLSGYSTVPFMITFDGSNAFDAYSFAPKIGFPTANAPTGITVSDLDGDGKPDLLVANYSSNTISVFRNTSVIGTISFASINDLAAGTGPFNIMAEDLNGDGKQDLVVTYNNSGTVSVFLSTSTSGTLSFSPRMDFAWGSEATDFSVADIDGDGRPDLIAINSYSSSVSILRNTCSGGILSFTAIPSFTLGYMPNCLSIGDLNGDWKPELIAPDMNTNKICILRNTSLENNISFAPKIEYSTGTLPYKMSTSDLDGDGKPEIAVANLTNTISILRNTSTMGSISFAAKVDFTTGTTPYDMSMNDLDGDGKPDLTILNNGAKIVSILRNMSTTGIVSFATKIDFATDADPMCLSTADLDGDSKPDIAISNSSSNTVSVLRNAVLPAPAISSFSPISATSGDTVTITGTNFIGVNTVTLGGTPAYSFNAVSATTIKAVVNTGSSGSISIKAQGRGTASLTGFSYTIPPAPSITSFTPTSAPNGTTVIVTGTNFIGTTSVKFGNTAAASYTVNSPTTITAVVAAGSSGSISITTPGGTASMAGFTFLLPTITSFMPTSGLAGTAVTITGANFSGTTSVKFGGTAATSYTVDSPTTITAVVGAGSSGSVSITTPGGTSSLAGFTYLPPTITSFTPASGKPDAVITITGTNFTGATAVKFGGTSAASYTINSPTSITAVVGAGSSGSVSVTTPGGTVSLAGFTFLSPPVISNFSPTVGTLGTIVTIIGSNFTGATSVTFGGMPAMSFSVVSPTTITAVVGSGISGMISVTTPNGMASNGVFTYMPLPVISSVTPASGPFNTVVTINGFNFYAVTSVKFGGTAAASYTLVSPTQIKAVVGTGSTGNISVTANGYTMTYPSFTYLETPTISSFSPISGPIGSRVTITGTHFNTVTSNNIVFFGATKAEVSSSTSTSLSVIVPGGASYRPISVMDVSTGLSATSINPFNTTFTGSNTLDAYSFATKVNFSAGDYPCATGIGDFDGDNKPDLVVVNNFGNSISLYRNTGTMGTISFAPRIDFAAGSYPESIAVCDLDGDGKLDLTVANSGSNTVSVYRNTSTSGSISFAPKIDCATGYHPASISICDWDGDGKFDLTTANYNSSSVSIIRNMSTSGTISFAQKSDISHPSGPEKITSGDLDGDGKPDLLVITLGGTVSLYRNTSSGNTISFAPKVDYVTGSNQEYISIGDLDGDGKSDITTANNSSNTISIFRNTSFVGTLSLAPKVDYSTGTRPTTISIGDLNGDGKPDLAVVNNYFNPVVSLFLNTCTSGTISFATKVDYTNGSYASSASIGDMDGDGKSDLIVTDYSNSLVSIFRSTVMPTPVITSITPTSATYGDTITISGSNFTGTTSVKFGGTSATNFIVISPTIIKAVIGSGTTGVVKVTVSSGANGLLSGFTYITPPVPTISSFTPQSALPGSTVVITGTNLSNATSVSFGGTPASSYTIDSPTSITAIVGSGASGNVSVTTPGGSASLVGFTYIASPTIASFSPASGISGTSVTISGTNFTEATSVSFGGIQASSYTVNSSTSITAIVGSGTSGNVTVTTPGGTASLTGFTYIPSPAIASFSPVSGISGTTVTISGTNFTGATTVSFGGTPASSFTVNSPNSITAIVGSGASGNVSVTTPGGTASLTGFTHIPSPTVTSFTPASGVSGTLVIISGTNFTGATAVTFGGTPAASFTVNSPNSIIATVGAGASGNISVTTPGGTVSQNGFTYVTLSGPTISSFSPSAAPTGSTIVITGTNFTNVTGVSFDSTPASSFIVDSPTSIRAVVGSGSTGSISVSTSGGTASLSGFVYLANQSITFNTLNEQTYGDADVVIGATASSSLPVIYTSSDTSIAKIISNKIRLVGAGSCIIYADQPGNSLFNAAPQVSRILKVRPKPLIITGVYASNKVYDGNMAVKLNGGSLNGIISPDVVTLKIGTGTFTDKNAGSSKTVIANGYSISGADATKYTLYAQPSGVTASIIQAPLSIVGVTANNKVYDGTTSVSLIGGSLTGIINPDVVILLKGTGVFTNKNVGNAKPIIISGYSIAGADAGNYKLSSQPAGITANITPVPVSLTDVSASNKVYNGSTMAMLTGGTLAGVINPDVVTVTKGIGVFTDKNVGNNKIVVASGYNLTGADAGNYSLIAQPSDISANITPAPLSITGVTVDNKAYDGTTIAKLTGGTLSGIISPDVVTLAGGTGIFTDKNQGNNKPVSISGYTITGPDAGNYILTSQPAGKTANITKAQLSITGISVSNKTYDGTSNATLTGGTLNGVINPDIVTLNPGTGIFSDKNVGNDKVVFLGGYTISGPDAGNYILAAQPSGITGSIMKASISITGVSANNKVYDGTTSATLTGGKLNGIIKSETVTLIAGNGVFSDKNVGNNKTVTASGYSISGIDANNYILSEQPSGITASITASPLTIKADAGQFKNQNTADPVFTYTIAGGSLISGETLNGALSRVAGESAGRYPIRIGSLTGGNNYKISFIPDTFNIYPTTGLSNISGDKPIVYPNPASDFIVLDTQEGTATLLDQQGKILYEVILNGKETFDLRKYSSGLYILILKTSSSTYRYKITKQ